MKRRTSKRRRCRNRRCRRWFEPRFGSLTTARCEKCVKAAKTERQRKRRRSRAWTGKAPKRSDPRWDRARSRASRKRCALCRARYSESCSRLPNSFGPPPKDQVRETIDHIVPWRLAERWGKNPHADWNLLSVCQRCHAKKRMAENLLMRGRVREAVEELQMRDWWSERVSRAFERFGLTATAVVRATSVSHPRTKEAGPVTTEVHPDETAAGPLPPEV